MSEADDTHARLVAAVRRASVAAASMGTRLADAFRKPQAPPPALPDPDRRATSEMCEPHNTRWCFYCHPREPQ